MITENIDFDKTYNLAINDFTAAGRDANIEVYGAVFITSILERVYVTKIKNNRINNL